MTIILAEHHRSPAGTATPLASTDVVPLANAAGNVDVSAHSAASIGANIATHTAAHTATHTAAHIDKDLAGRAARGEPGAFAALYQRHVEAVFHYFSFRVRDTTLAEDLTHDVFVAALKAAHTVREPEKFVGWLMRIAHNRLANHWRSSSHAAEPLPPDLTIADLSHALPFDTTSSDPARWLDALTDAPRLTSALARLTPLQHDVVALRFIAGLSVVETADAVGRSVNAVKNVQHQALVKLRAELASTEIA